MSVTIVFAKTNDWLALPIGCPIALKLPRTGDKVGRLETFTVGVPTIPTAQAPLCWA